MEDENNVLVAESVPEEESQDDGGSNNSAGSTASHSSEEFVKVNKDDASLDQDAGDMTREDDVEEIKQTAQVLDEGGSCGMNQKASDNMASENYLRDYYDQLPSETAEFTTEDSARAGDDITDYDNNDFTSVLQPEVMPSNDPYQISPVQEVEEPFAVGEDLRMGGDHPAFEPAPAASFEPEPPRSKSPVTPSPSPIDPSQEEDDLFIRETESDEQSISSQGSESQLEKMSSEQEHQEPVSPEGDADFEEEAEQQPVVVSEQQEEVEDVAPAEDVEEPDVDVTPVDEIKEEIRDVPAPVVEEIDTKPESASIVSQCPTAADDEKHVEKDQDPVIDLIYWRDIKKTAFVFSALLVVLGSLTCFSIISVVSYTGLALLTVTVAFRLYKLVLQTLNGTHQPHPFQALLDTDVTLSQERMQKYTNAVLGHLNCCLVSARDLLLVKNTINSLKLGVFLWLLSYIGCCFNGLTLLIIDVVLTFTVPPIYEKYQTQIDNYYGLAREKVCAVMATVKAKLPGAKQAAKEKAQ